jgi:hypothetical protein
LKMIWMEALELLGKDEILKLLKNGNKIIYYK